MTLLAEIAEHLRSDSVRFAAIGAAALSVHGVARATADIDLMTVDRRVLVDAFWRGLAAEADVRVGDYDDPLAGVVRLRSKRDVRPVDVVVGKYRFIAKVIECAERGTVGGVEVPVATLVDLVLLKLFAGGPQDAWDIEQATAIGGARLVDEVDRRVGDLPEEARQLWSRIRSRRS